MFKVSKNASKKERFSKNILSGGCAGSLSLVFVQSIDYTRTRLAVDTLNAKTGGRRQFSGIVDVYVKTIKSDGVRGLYRGFAISCSCIFIYRGLYFGLFDSLKPLGGTINLRINIFLQLQVHHKLPFQIINESSRTFRNLL